MYVVVSRGESGKEHVLHPLIYRLNTYNNWNEIRVNLEQTRVVETQSLEL